MNRKIDKFLNQSLKKIKEHKERIKKLKLSSCKEDFVMTAQEEREGGFFGDTRFSRNIQLKLN